jgi:hypothetical protein
VPEAVATQMTGCCFCDILAACDSPGSEACGYPLYLLPLGREHTHHQAPWTCFCCPFPCSCCY